MAVPELSWLIPVVIPFIIGLFIGFIVRRTVKLVFLVIALIIVLAAVGYISLTYQDVYDVAMQYLPKITELGGGLMNTLPYVSTMFLIGLAIGLWKG